VSDEVTIKIQQDSVNVNTLKSDDCNTTYNLLIKILVNGISQYRIEIKSIIFSKNPFKKKM
jgi:hypothetical protein